MADLQGERERGETESLRLIDDEKQWAGRRVGVIGGGQ